MNTPGSRGTPAAWSERLRQLDHHTSVSSEFRVSTKLGAVLSITTLIVLIHLLRTEYRYNLTPTIRDRVHVNATTPAGVDIEFDISFPHIQCALLAVDSEDPTGQSQSLHIDRTHRIFKHRMNADGELIGHKSKFEIGGTIQDLNQLQNKSPPADAVERHALEELEDEEECGSCYGAKADGECCNTCDDVKNAYMQKGWLFDPGLDVKQCRHVVDSDEEQGEGCNIHGTIALSSGGGNLHIAPSRAFANFGTEKESNAFVQLLRMAFDTYNVTHTIHKLRFGQEFPGHVHPLDGQSRFITDDHGMYQYYLQIVPTLYRYLNGTSIQTNQYSVTEHLRHVPAGSKRGLPGVFFFYEVSPLHVEIEEAVRGWVHFFTGVCAVVGGVFSFMSMLDGFLFMKLGDKKGSALG
jgi:hypothetical protein